MDSGMWFYHLHHQIFLELILGLQKSCERRMIYMFFPTQLNHKGCCFQFLDNKGWGPTLGFLFLKIDNRLLRFEESNYLLKVKCWPLKIVKLFPLWKKSWFVEKTTSMIINKCSVMQRPPPHLPDVDNRKQAFPLWSTCNQHDFGNAC